MLHLLDTIESESNEFNRIYKLVFGDSTQKIYRISAEQLNTVIEKCQAIPTHPECSDMNSIIYEIHKLTWKPLGELVRKYETLVKRLSAKLDKKVEFIVEPKNALQPSNSFIEIDDVLIHIIRNAVDHGIESNEIRQQRGKGIGTITLKLTTDTPGMRCIQISDNGDGINTEKLSKKAVENGIITETEALTLSEDAKIQLIFSPFLSTSEEVSTISGRGVGMDVVAKKIRELNGTIEIRSTFGKGTTFSLAIPTQLKSIKKTKA